MKKMILRTSLLLVTLSIAIISCKKRYKNPEPVAIEVASANGNVGGKDIALNSGVNNYYPFYSRDTAGGKVTYVFSLRTGNTNEDYFKFIISNVAFGADSNDTDDLKAAISNQIYPLDGKAASSPNYGFSYFKNGVEYSANKDVSGNITIYSSQDLGMITVTDHKTMEENADHYFEVKVQLDKVKLFDEKNNELGIEKLNFVGRFATMGDLKKKK